jgi:serine/threonine protein kinase/Tfp pilus assembly protein PilF
MMRGVSAGSFLSTRMRMTPYCTGDRERNESLPTSVRAVTCPITRADRNTALPIRSTSPVPIRSPVLRHRAYTAQHPFPMIGRTLGQYRIDAKLGAGGMGVVYRAHDLRLRRDVALKLLPDGLAANDAERARLQHEALAASTLNHANIAVVYDVGDVDGRAYIAMEFVEGRPLRDHIPPQGLPFDTLLRYGRQIASALAHAHDRGVVHRDLKSANIVITAEGDAKVLDFGLARRAEFDAQQVTQSRDPLSRGEIAGTLPYMAPELLRGELAEPRSDIWAFGVLLYEMATGELPFTGNTGFELSSAILRERPAPLPSRVGPGLRAVLERALAKEKSQRYRTAGELRAALEATARDPAATPDAAAPLITTRGRSWRSGTAAALIATGIAVAWWKIPLPFEVGGGVVGSVATAPTDSTPRLSTGAPASPNAEANEHFERAMVLLRRRWETLAARQTLLRALELDPRFAEARAFLGFVDLLRLDSGESNDAGLLYRAEDELRRALQDDPQLVRGHAVLAAVYMYLQRRELAKSELDKALALAPDELTTVQWLGHSYMMIGDHAAARGAFEKNLKRDPLFLPSRHQLAGVHRVEGNHDLALRELQKILDQDPQNIPALLSIARTYVDVGDTEKAEAAVTRAGTAAEKNYAMRLVRALIHARRGNRTEALEMLDAEVRQFAEVHVVPTNGSTIEAAEVYSLLNDTAPALEWFERAVRSGDERLDWFQRNPLLANIRSHPRFKEVLHSIEFRRRQQAPSR